MYSTKKESWNTQRRRIMRSVPKPPSIRIMTPIGFAIEHLALAPPSMSAFWFPRDILDPSVVWKAGRGSLPANGIVKTAKDLPKGVDLPCFELTRDLREKASTNRYSCKDQTDGDSLSLPLRSHFAIDFLAATFRLQHDLRKAEGNFEEVPKYLSSGGHNIVSEPYPL